MGGDGDDGVRKRRPGRPRRLAGAGLSLAAHAALLAALLWAAPQVKVSPPPSEPAVAFLDAPPAPAPSPTPSPAASPSPAPPAPSQAPTKAAAPAQAVKAQARTPSKPSRPVRAARSSPVHADPEPEDDGGDEGNSVAPELTGAELAGAVSAGSGGGGGGGPCDMARRVQAALRRDPVVAMAVAGARLAPGLGAHALLVWNGDWVQSGGEDGKGLSAVREAIMWEVGFAPAACRTGPMHGFILFTLSEAPGAPRLAIGAPAWRWADLLGAR